MIDLKHPNAKLTVEQVQAIRTLLWHGYTIPTIAATFNVSPRTVDYIQSERTWGHLPYEPADINQLLMAPDCKLRLRGKLKPSRRAGAEREMVGAA